MCSRIDLRKLCYRMDFKAVETQNLYDSCELSSLPRGSLGRTGDVNWGHKLFTGTDTDITRTTYKPSLFFIGEKLLAWTFTGCLIGTWNFPESLSVNMTWVLFPELNTTFDWQIWIKYKSFLLKLRILVVTLVIPLVVILVPLIVHLSRVPKLLRAFPLSFPSALTWKWKFQEYYLKLPSYSIYYYYKTT